MACLALILWLVFGLLAIAGPRLAPVPADRVVGPDRNAAAGLARLEWWGGVSSSLAIAAAVAAPILDLAGTLDPYEDLDSTGVQVAGVVLFAIGLVGTFALQIAMGDSWRVGVDEAERTELVTDGPFAVVRNPIYSTMLPAMAGIALLVPNPVSFGAIVLMIVALEIQTRLTKSRTCSGSTARPTPTTRPGSAASCRGHRPVIPSRSRRRRVEPVQGGADHLVALGLVQDLVPQPGQVADRDVLGGRRVSASIRLPSGATIGSVAE